MTEQEAELEALATRLNANVSEVLSSMVLHLVENINKICSESGEDIIDFLITDNLEAAFTNIFWNVLYVSKSKNFIDKCISMHGNMVSAYPGIRLCKQKAKSVRLGVSIGLFSQYSIAFRSNKVVYFIVGESAYRKYRLTLCSI